METTNNIIEQIKKQRIVPLFFHEDKTVSREVTRALYRAGIRCIEYTHRGENAFENFKALLEERNQNLPDLLLGIGTIRTAKQAKEYIDAGADFLVSPMFEAAVADVAYTHKTIWAPGCMTPTEIHAAENAGCSFIKLFPGNVLGPSFVSSIKDIFPKTTFMVTGGVEATKESMQAWFASGAAAVGIGGKLITKKDLAEKNYTAIEERTKQILQLIE